MKQRIYAILLLLCLPIVTLIRTWQLSTAMDANGFYLEPYADLCRILGFGALGLALVFLLAGRFFIGQTATVILPKKSIALGIGALALVVCCVPQLLTDFSAATTENAQVLAIVPTGVLAVCFSVMSACLFVGKAIPFVACVFPIITEFIRLIADYAHFNGIAQISESIISILFSCAFLCFCLCHCRVFSQVDSKNGMGWALGTAAVTAIFGFLVSVPHLIAGQNQHTLSTLGLGAAIYATLFLFAVEGNGQPKVRAKHLKVKKSQ